MNENYLIFDGVALGAEAGKLPTGWKVLSVGENTYTQNGAAKSLTFTAEQLAGIAGYHQAKGEKIPIDSRHALFLAAEAHGVTENEVRRLLPHGTGALGFANLVSDDAGCHVANVEWLPLAAELVKDGMFRYYSPVIRGLDGKSPLRITSIALDNVPALNQIDVIAAGGELTPQPKQEDRMNKTLTALRKLLGSDALALGAETDDATAVAIEALAAELPALRDKAAQTEALALAAENAKRDALIAAALADGQLDNVQKPWAQQLDIAVLSDIIANTPKNSRLPMTPLPGAKKDDGESDELSDDEKKFAGKMGLSAEDYKKGKEVCK